MKSRIKLLLASTLLAGLALAQEAQTPAAPQEPAVSPPPAPPASPLDQPAHAYNVMKQPIEQAFYLLGRTYGVPFIVDPAITGEINRDLPAGGTVRHIIDAIVQPLDLYYEEIDGRVYIKAQKEVFYELLASPNTRTSSSQTSIALSSSSSGSLNSQNQNGAINPQNATTSNGMSGNSQTGGQSNISISEKNETDFWANVATDLQKTARASEHVTINPNSGLLIVTASPKRHREHYEPYVAQTNEKVGRQVDIDAQILEVTTNDDHKLGVDYSAITAKLGDITLEAASLASDISTIGPTTLPGNTLTGRISAGKVTAFINALSEQAEVRTIAKPQVRVMNNQTAYLVVGREQGFFTLSATQTTGNTTTGTSTTESAVYTKETLTFGTIFSVTASIPTPNDTILDVKPERSKLVRVDKSPDNRQQAAVTDVQRAGTRLSLKNGDTTILAGLANSTVGTATRGAPGLAKLPFIGALFRTDARTTSRSELVIIITARIHAPTAASVRLAAAPTLTTASAPPR